jgi:hypothetical protein
MESQVKAAPTTRRSLRGLMWVALASLLAIGMLATASGGTLVSATANVTNLNQTPPIASTDPNFQGDAGECEGANLSAGQVLWHFVLTQTSAGTAGSILHATFSSGQDIEVVAYKKAGGVLHWEIITGATSLTGAHTNRAGRNLNLSHICQGPPETTTTETTSTETTSTETTETTATSSELADCRLSGDRQASEHRTGMRYPPHPGFLLRRVQPAPDSSPRCSVRRRFSR